MKLRKYAQEDIEWRLSEAFDIIDYSIDRALVILCRLHERELAYKHLYEHTEGLLREQARVISNAYCAAYEKLEKGVSLKLQEEERETL